MSDAKYRDAVPALRRETVVPALTPPLLKRGLDVLEHENTVPLPVVDLTVCGESFFVMSSDWDRDANIPFGFPMPTSRRTWLQRDVILYEFRHTGEFIQRLNLRLIRLTAEGYSRITSQQRGWVTGREPGTITIRSSFIHFYEELAVRDYSRPVRIDYLFSRSGERLAVWCNEEFADMYRVPGESYAPSGSGVRPDFLTDEYLVRVDSDLWYRRPSGDLIEESSDQHVGIVLVNDFIEMVRKPNWYEHYGRIYTSLSRTQTLDQEVFSFPYPTMLVDNRPFSMGWERTSTDTSSVWFMPYWSSDDTTSWRLSFEHGRASMGLYTLPHPKTLKDEGVISIPDSWDLDDDDWSLNAKQMFVSGKDVLAGFEMLGPPAKSDGALAPWQNVWIHFRVGASELIPEREVDPAGNHFRNLLIDREQMKTEEQEDMRDIYTKIRWLENSEALGFGNGLLFAKCDSRDADRRHTVIVTDVSNEQVSWFDLRVPASAAAPSFQSRLTIRPRRRPEPSPRQIRVK